jgi:hypothetical protein
LESKTSKYDRRRPCPHRLPSLQNPLGMKPSDNVLTEAAGSLYWY